MQLATMTIKIENMLSEISQALCGSMYMKHLDEANP